MKYTFHLLGLVHLPTARKYLSCAFTQKNVKLAKMLCDRGHTVYLYGARSKEEQRLEEYVKSDNFHFVETHTVKDIARDYGDGDNRFELGYDYTNSDFRHDFNSEKKSSTLKFYSESIRKIKEVMKPDHFLLCTQGNYHLPIADNVGLFLTCESGIGYRGSVRRLFRAFESHHAQSFAYGSEAPFQDRDGSFYDRVIPNYFDDDDILYSEKKKDYYLFIGRMIKRKGILTAALACNAIGRKLIIAGQGAAVNTNGQLVPLTDPDFILDKGTWEYVGYADVEKRKRLMAYAKAVFVPTEYLENFAGVHCEAMLSGTPVITTDFGVFGGNTFMHGVHGFKCNTLQDFVDAARNVSKLKPRVIRKWAEQYLMGNVVLKYEKWFNDLYQVYLSTDGKTPGWHQIL